jgi:hypothetical protein
MRIWIIYVIVVIDVECGEEFERQVRRAKMMLSKGDAQR